MSELDFRGCQECLKKDMLLSNTRDELAAANETIEKLREDHNNFCYTIEKMLDNIEKELSSIETTRYFIERHSQALKEASGEN